MSIEIVGLSCRGRQGYGLSRITLRVATGDGCVLVGPNGSGKSLLLAVLAGLARPSAGSVTVNGFDLVRQTSQARRAVGYASQWPAGFSGLTVQEHLSFLARCHGQGSAQRRESVATILEVVGLQEAARLEAAALTPGQQRRLALAGALVHNPPVLLLDTPFAGLDPVAREEMLEVLKEVRALGSTVLLAADRPAEVLALCGQAAALEGGELRWQGPAADLPYEFGGSLLVEASPQPPLLGR